MPVVRAALPAMSEVYVARLEDVSPSSSSHRTVVQAWASGLAHEEIARRSNVDFGDGAAVAGPFRAALLRVPVVTEASSVEYFDDSDHQEHLRVSRERVPSSPSRRPAVSRRCAGSGEPYGDYAWGTLGEVQR